MRIRRIKIQNFRNLKDFEVFPSNSTILFVGENNSGKSNLIHALRLIFDQDSKRLSSEISKDDLNDIARSEGHDFFNVCIEIGDLQNHQELEAIFRDRIHIEGDETFISVEGKYSKDEDNIYHWIVNLLPPEGSKNEPLPFSFRMANSIPLYFLDAVRDASREMRASGRGALSQLINKIDFKDVEDEVISNLQAANKALHANADMNELASNITDLIAPHIPGGEGEVSLAVATEDPTQLVKGLRLILKRKSDLKAYDMSRHGTGIQNLLLIAMFRHRIITSGGIQPILAIEEPEAHLHPQGQRCLFKDLESIENPVIITTHSPSIVECSNPISIIRLISNENNYINSHQINPEKYGINEQKLLSRMMRSGRSHAFFARTIIVVEGPSEVIAIPAFANKMGHNLDREGVSIIPADGNAFSFILRACDKNNFCISTVITFDTDSLHSSNNLVKEAYKAGLISQEIRNTGKESSAEIRQSILEDIGWIPVDPNFEEEVCRIGYIELILKLIDEEEETQSLESFLTLKKYGNNAQGVASYLNSKKGRGLKVPVARMVASEVESIGSIPKCFEEAIKKAVDLSLGGIIE